MRTYPDGSGFMLFELEHVTKIYGPITALNDLSVQIPKGAIGLLGPNGAGKTTMIRTLLGLIRFNSGGGRVLGMDIVTDRLKIRQQVGFLPEDECLFPAMSGVDFVAYAGELAGMASKDAMQRAHEVLDYSGLGEQRYRPTDSYSTGMKQRLKLATAIVHDPKLLIMDEPTNGLDPKGRDDMLDLARDLAHNKDMSILFSSHLLPDVESVCEHIMVMGRGKLLANGKIADLKKQHETAFVIRTREEPTTLRLWLERAGCRCQPTEDMLEVALPAGQNESLIWQAARESQQQIRHMRPRQSTLEEVFLSALKG